MPLLTLSTNTNIEQADKLAVEISAFVADLLGKPESYVMVKIEAVQALSFAGSAEAAAHLQLKSLGLATTETTELSASLCDFIESKLQIKSGRIYIEFASPERAMWGWDRRTFA